MQRLHAIVTGTMLACLAVSTGCAPAVAPEARLHRMGERVTAGSLTYNIFEDRWKTELGEGAQARVPKERFFLVRLNVVNGGAAEAMVPTMTLVDDSGQTFTELSDGDHVPGWIGFLRRLKPADTLQGNVVFDVPPKHYRLRVTDESSQKTEEVDIPLTFTNDTQDMPTPVQ